MTEQVKIEVNKCLLCKKPSCVLSCPAHNNIKDIISYLRCDDITSAVKLMEETNPLSFVCGILCDHGRQCSGVCNNKKNPVEIGKICHFVGSNKVNTKLEKINNLKGKIAVVGGGPAGLVISEILMKNGLDVTIFEKENRLGGVLTNSIPDFRFDLTEFNKWIDSLIDFGLNVELNCEIGKTKSLTELISFDYIVIATGAPIPRYVLDKEYSYSALDLLVDYKNGKSVPKDKNVIVLGGGNTALDVARMLKRVGNNVTICYRRDMANAPATKEEIAKAYEDGVLIKEYLSPKDIIKENDIVKGVLFNKTKLVDSTEGRKNFVVTDEEVAVDCDMIVQSLGTIVDLSFVNELDESLLDEKGYAKNLINDKIYFIGDAYTGPKTFVSAASTAVTAAADILKKLS